MLDGLAVAGSAFTGPKKVALSAAHAETQGGVGEAVGFEEDAFVVPEGVADSAGFALAGDELGEAVVVKGPGYVLLAPDEVASICLNNQSLSIDLSSIIPRKDGRSLIHNKPLRGNGASSSLLILTARDGSSRTGSIGNEIEARVAKQASSVLVVGVAIGGLPHALSVVEGPSVGT